MLSNILKHELDGGEISTQGQNKWIAPTTAFAYHNHCLLLVSYVSSPTIVDAIRANFSLGKEITLSYRKFVKAGTYGTSPKVDRWEMLTHNVITKGQKFTAYRQRFDDLYQDHFILVNNVLTAPMVDGEYAYAIGSHDEHPATVIGRTMRESLTIPILPTWYDWIYEQVRVETDYRYKIEKLDCSKGVHLYAIPPRDEFWAKCIKKALAEGILKFTGDES